MSGLTGHFNQSADVYSITFEEICKARRMALTQDQCVAGIVERCISLGLLPETFKIRDDLALKKSLILFEILDQLLKVQNETRPAIHDPKFIKACNTSVIEYLQKCGEVTSEQAPPPSNIKSFLSS